MTHRILVTTLSVLFALIALPAMAGDNVHVPAGAVHDGNLETRNGFVRIGDRAVVEGSIESRNGSVEAGASVVAGDVRTRNGAIKLGDGGQFGRIESRNGPIELGAESSAGAIETRNGSIRIGATSRTGRIDSRNGSIAIDADVAVDGPASTRNGGVTLARGSRVDGKITTRNGGVELDGATVGQGIQSRTGDIVLNADSSVGGDLIIEVGEHDGSRSSGFFGFGASQSWPRAGSVRVLDDSLVEGDLVLRLPTDYDERLPVVEVAQGARVTGNLVIDSRAELIVHGQVDGDIERVTP